MKTNSRQQTYVYGLGLDDVLHMRRGSSNYFYHADQLGSVRAVTDANGTVLERYDYGDFGAPQVLTPAGIPRPQTAIGNPHLFTGHRYDLETGFYYCRTRYLDPSVGRFTTRDTIGIWRDADMSKGKGSARVN